MNDDEQRQQGAGCHIDKALNAAAVDVKSMIRSIDVLIDKYPSFARK